MVEIMAKGWLVSLADWEGEVNREYLIHKFLLPGLREACHMTRVKSTADYQLLHLQFFQGLDTVNFIFIQADGSETWENVKKKVSRQYKRYMQQNEQFVAARFILCVGDEVQCAKQGSKFIRDSETLAHNEAMTLNRGIHLLSEPRGFACYASDQKDVNLMLSNHRGINQFERFVLLFALGLAYRGVILSIIKLMGDSLNQLQLSGGGAVQMYRKLAALRESIVMFDARYYFQTPVQPEKQELFSVVQHFMQILHVHPLHEEMAHQLGEVSHLADHKLEIIQQDHRNAMLLHQEQAAEQHERKMGRLNIMLAIVALLLTSMDLLSHPPSEWWHAISEWASLL